MLSILYMQEEYIKKTAFAAKKVQFIEKNLQKGLVDKDNKF